MKNLLIIRDLSQLCLILDYENRVVINKNRIISLYLKSSSLSKFYKDYLVLLSEHPEVDLGWKGLKIKEFIDRINKPQIYRLGNKEVILTLLDKEDLTVNELSIRLKMTRQGVRYLINHLVREERIEVKSIVKFANWKYGVKNASRNSWESQHR